MLTSALLVCLIAGVQEPPKLSALQMVFLRSGPTPVPPGADTAKLQAAHLELLNRLNQQRVNLLYGPFLDNTDLRGIAVVDVPDAAAARALFAADPYIQAGHMVVEVRPWYGVKETFHLPDAPPTPEQFVFGFLMRGASTGQSPEEAQQIQAGHLAYMESLHKQGKLVAAGPFGDNSEFRGIVIYRVATLEEARALAAGDPAVKAGRLVIDARPWMTFKGILK
jgi:uncharacterized protein YciI